MSERTFLSPAEAEAMLPEGDYVHVISNPTPNLMIGADWKREEVLKALRTLKPELSGDAASAMNHRIAILEPRRIFIQTREAK